MEPAAPASARPLRRPARRRLPGRTDDDAVRARATRRHADASVAVGAHGATPAAHDGRGAAVLDGRADRSTLRRLAPMDSAEGPRPADHDVGGTPDAVAAAPGHRLGRLRPGALGLARAGALRSCARLRRLAPRRTRLFPRERAAVLAARDPRLAGQDPLAPLDDGALPGS